MRSILLQARRTERAAIIIILAAFILCQCTDSEMALESTASQIQSVSESTEEGAEFPLEVSTQGGDSAENLVNDFKELAKTEGEDRLLARYREIVLKLLPDQRFSLISECFAGANYKMLMKDLIVGQARAGSYGTVGALENAIGYFQKINNEEIRLSAVAPIARGLLAKNRSAAFDWIANELNDLEARKAYSSIVLKEGGLEASADKVRKLKGILAEITDEYGKKYLVEQTAMTMADLNVWESAQWIMEQPLSLSGRSKDRLVETMFELNWESALPYADAWINEEDGDERILAIASAFARANPGEAQNWANTLANSSRKEIVERWVGVALRARAKKEQK